jgi:hypothetical protein
MPQAGLRPVAYENSLYRVLDLAAEFNFQLVTSRFTLKKARPDPLEKWDPVCPSGTVS